MYLGYLNMMQPGGTFEARGHLRLASAAQGTLQEPYPKVSYTYIVYTLGAKGSSVGTLGLHNLLDRYMDPLG